MIWRVIKYQFYSTLKFIQSITFFCRLLIFMNLLTSILYIKYSQYIFPFMISNTTTIRFHFYQFLTFPYVSHSNILFLATNLYFTAGLSRLEKQMGSLGFVYYFIMNNVIIGLLSRVFLHLFNEYTSKPEECPGSPCLIYGSCAFTTFFYYKLLIQNPDSTYSLFGYVLKLKYLPWILTIIQFFLFALLFSDLIDYFIDSVIGIFMVFLRIIYIDSIKILNWTVISKKRVERMDKFLKEFVLFKSYVLLPEIHKSRAILTLNTIELA